jgi:hypothetical protein
VSLFLPHDDDQPGPSISIHPPPAEAELVAIVAAVLIVMAETHGGAETVRMMRAPSSRWAEAGRCEARTVSETISGIRSSGNKRGVEGHGVRCLRAP